MLPLLGYLSIPFLVPLNKLQNLIHVIHKGSIICNDWAQGDIFIGRCLFFFWETACTFVGNVRLVPRKKRVPRALLLEKCSRYLYATGCEVGNYVKELIAVLGSITAFCLVPINAVWIFPILNWGRKIQEI